MQITEGGQVNNWLGEWSRDGQYLAYSSNAAGNGGMDCWLVLHRSRCSAHDRQQRWHR